MNDRRERGRLKVYDVIKGFGFIERERGQDVFVRYADFANKDNDASALVGAMLEFDLINAPKGPKASNVEVVG